jgi:hypothetical protein
MYITWDEAVEEGKRLVKTAANQFTLETVPPNSWFYGDEPITSAMDILLAARRMNCEIMYDEAADVCRITYQGEVLPSMKLDDIHYLFTKFTYRFKFRIEKRHTMDAIGVLRRDPSSVFNSRLDYLNGFLPILILIGKWNALKFSIVQ